MQLQQSDIMELLSRYELGLIKEIKPVITSGNRSFLITTNLGQYFLRLSGDLHRQRSQQEIEGELVLLDKLKVNNFPVIDCLSGKADERVINWEKRYGYLRKYLAGNFVTGDPSEKQLGSVGKLLGQYHNIVADLEIKQRENINFGLAKTLEYFHGHEAEFLASNFKSAQEFVSQFKKVISQINFSADLPQGMIHEDLGKRHILWQDDKIATLLDFDRSYFGPLILDLGQALRGWCFINNWQNWSQENVRIFLANYETARKLSTLEKEFLSAAVKFAILERALSFYSRAVYSSRTDTAEEKFALDSLERQVNLLKI